MSIETPTPKRTRRFVSKVPQEPGAPGFGPSMPTCGNDLIGLWDLPAEAIKGARLKIARTIPMSQKLELVRDCTVQDYSMESVAHSYGPGEYQIILNPGPMGAWGGKSARLTISADYARESGFSVYQEPPPAAQAPRFSDLRSVNESARALQTGQAFTPEIMAQLIETTAARVAAQMKPAAAPDPMQVMGPMVQMMTFLQTMQKSAVDQALALAGMKTKPEPADDDEGDSWPSVIREALPMLGEIGKGLMSRSAPVAGQVQTIQPEPQEAPAVSVPLSQDEIRHFAPAVAMLKPYANMVGTIIGKVARGEDASADLASFIPNRMHPLMIEFSEVAKQRGPAVLAILAPELATDKALACIVGIGEILSEV